MSSQFPPIPDDYFAEQLQHEADLARRYPLHRCIDPRVLRSLDQPIGDTSPHRFQSIGDDVLFVIFLAGLFATAILL